MNDQSSAYDIDIPGVGPVSVVLETIFSLCERLMTTNKSPGVLLDHFLRVWTEIKRSELEEKRDDPDDIVGAFTQVLVVFFTAIQPYEHESEQERLVRDHTILGQACDDGHVALNALCVRLGLEVVPVHISAKPTTTPVVTTITGTASTVPPLGQLIWVLEAIQNTSKVLKDFKASVQFTHGRLTVILDELKNVEANKTMPPSGTVEKFHRTLTVLWADIAPYQDISLVARVLRQSRLKDTIVTVNVEIDGLFHMLAIATTAAMMDWRNQWALDVERHNTEMKKLMESNYELMESVRSIKAQMDALVLLSAELAKMDVNESEQPPEVQRFVEDSFRVVARLFNGNLPVLPQWFVPETSVTYTPEYFARGSFGSVHHGKYLGADVVVKLLLPGENGIQTSDRDDFLKEVNLWYTFDSPHVLQMYGASHVSSRPFIVAGYAKNGNVADWLQNPASRFQMWKCIYQAALGLNYLHSKNVVHGNVRLNNLLVGADGDVRVADFGLSRVKTSSRSRFSTLASGTEVEGGLHWLAPERFKFKPHYLSDVYALGMCIIEAALGDAPYGRLDSASVRAKIENGELPAKPTKLSDDGWLLVQKMTVKDPLARITLEETISELERLAAVEAMNLWWMAPYCDLCRTPLRLEAKFCDQCGRSLLGNESSTDTPVP